MSIATKTGDSGTTGLMYNRRVSKCHPRVETYGTVDELNTAIGMVRAFCEINFVADSLLNIQKDLVILMGELATLNEDLDRYISDGFKFVTEEMTSALDSKISEIEAQNISFKGWATPGSCKCSAHLDHARTTCRRSERRVCGQIESGELRNKEILVYLNRLSDLLWLFARWVEAQREADANDAE